MAGRVLILGRVATANVAAAQAQAKMHPAVAHLQAFFTPASMRFYLMDLIEMCALCQCLPTFLSFLTERYAASDTSGSQLPLSTFFLENDMSNVFTIT
jgi:hypothetical protein